MGLVNMVSGELMTFFYKDTIQASPILPKGEGKIEDLSGDKMNLYEIIALYYSENALVY